MTNRREAVVLEFWQQLSGEKCAGVEHIPTQALLVILQLPDNCLVIPSVNAMAMRGLSERAIARRAGVTRQVVRGILKKKFVK